MAPVRLAEMSRIPRSFCPLAVAIGFMVLLAPDPALAAKPVPLCTPVVPCADSRGCPDLVIDPGILADVTQSKIVTRTFAADDCAVVEGMVGAGTRRLLQFATMTVNVGAGDLFLGNPYDHPDWFDLVTCHGHPHVKDYADYRLWTVPGYQQWTALRAADPAACAQQILDANPSLLTQLVNGVKRGFCIIDIVPTTSQYWPHATVACPGTVDPAKYFDCDYSGLSVCWADVYEQYLDGQWIDVTNVPDGDYVLENEADGKHFFTETDYTNNSAAIAISIRGKLVKATH